MKGSIGRVVEWALRRDALPRDVIESQLELARRELVAAQHAAAQAREECGRLKSESASVASSARDAEQRASSLQRDLEMHSSLTDALRAVLAVSDDVGRASVLAQRAAALTSASACWMVCANEPGSPQVRASLAHDSPAAPSPLKALASWWFQSQGGHSLRLAAGHTPLAADESETDAPAGIDQAVLAVRVELAPLVGVLLLRDDGFSGRDEVAARELAELVATASRICSEREQAMRAQLERALADADRRDRELNDARAALVARERQSMLGQVTATVSHELRNPLGVIRSSVFYLQRRLGSTDEKVIKHLDRIEQQVGLCNGVIDDLLEFTRGRQTYLVPGDINAWLSSVIQAQASSDTPVFFRTELAPDLPAIAFDADKLRRAMANLLENAELAVKARAEQPDQGEWRAEIVARTVLREDGVAIQLIDNGVGMDEATRLRAFDPLFTTRARGTGLGLPIVRKIVDDHGGRISIESSAWVATTVTILLPFPSASVTSPEASP